MDISGVENLTFMILQGVVNTFRTWNNMTIAGISYLSIAFSFIIFGIIFSIVFAYVRSRVYNSYGNEKRNKK